MSLKKHVEKLHEIKETHKSAKAQVAIRVVLKKVNQNIIQRMNS